MIKSAFFKGFIGGFLFTSLLVLTIFSEVDVSGIRDFHTVIIKLIAVFFASSFIFSGFIISIKYHSAIKKEGWKRVLIILSLFTLPASIFLVLNYASVSGGWGYFVALTFPPIFTYIIIIAAYFAFFAIYKWVKDGFVEYK